MHDPGSIARALHWSVFMQMVAEYGESGIYDRERAAVTLEGYARFCAEMGRAVDLPPAFAELLALDLRGVVKRQGRR
ncbi:MAG: hypothetical protein CVT71_03130, partial [Alphaproteobacteria bacterium HGW-Alphaproteobacteria-10]